MIIHTQIQADHTQRTSWIRCRTDDTLSFFVFSLNESTAFPTPPSNPRIEPCLLRITDIAAWPYKPQPQCSRREQVCKRLVTPTQRAMNFITEGTNLIYVHNNLMALSNCTMGSAFVHPIPAVLVIARGLLWPQYRMPWVGWS